MIDLERFRNGDRQYFEEQIRNYGPLVLTVTRAHGQDLDHSEDLFQEVWKRVYQKRGSFSGKGRFDAWVRRVANNVCIGNHRARKARDEAMVRLEQLERSQDHIQENGDPLEEMEREELQILLHRALNLLSKREYEAIDLYYFERRPTDEIAKIMGVERSTVRSLIRKGIARLKTISEKLK